MKVDRHTDFLAQRFELAYAYSATGAQASLTVKAGSKKPTQTLLVLANPDFAQSLARLPRSLLSGEARLQPQCGLGTSFSSFLLTGKVGVSEPPTWIMIDFPLFEPVPPAPPPAERSPTDAHQR